MHLFWIQPTVEWACELKAETLVNKNILFVYIDSSLKRANGSRDNIENTVNICWKVTLVKEKITHTSEVIVSMFLILFLLLH